MKRARLPRPIAPLLAPEARLDGARLWSQIALGRADRLARTRTRAALGLACLAALGVALLSLIHTGPYAHPHTGSAALALADRQALPRSIAPRDRYRALALDDGSYLTVAAGARLDVLEASGRVASFALRDGRARFDIRPHGPRRWRVDCGAVTIEVVGTAFVLERDARTVSVKVLRGAVLVRGESVPDRVQRLGAGQQLTSAIASEPRADVIPDAMRPVTQTPVQPQASIHRNATTPRRAWREAARDAQWNAAFAALDHGGLARELSASSKVDDLLLLADVARLSGHPGDAVAPLGRIVREHPRDPRAALAAFTLGRIRLDALGDPAGAIADIERALELGLPHALAKDARARLAEAQHRLGAPEREGASAPQ